MICESPPVVIVNETFARRFLQAGNPVGQRIRNPSPAPGEQRGWMEVVGVVADATYLSLRDAVPATQYVPLAQQEGSGPFNSLVSLSIRTAGRAPSLLARSVAETIALVDPNIAITFTPLKQQVDAALIQERIVAILSGFFGALGLLLAGLGLYGVTAYTVTSRRTEIGIRMALGAQPGSVVRFVLGRVALTIAAGIAIGAGLGAWAAKFVASLLYGLQPGDPMTLACAALTLSLVGAMAGWVPARALQGFGRFAGIDDDVDELGALDQRHRLNLRGLRVDRDAEIRLFVGAHPDIADRLHENGIAIPGLAVNNIRGAIS
jgi:hypothetical protein